MKIRSNETRITMNTLLGCLGLAFLTGCSTAFHYSEFAPLEARLEPASGGGQCLVVANTSGKVLHDLRYSGYIRYDQALRHAWGQPGIPTRRPVPTDRFEGSISTWKPGDIMRFKDRDLKTELAILEPVSWVELAGSCDEGQFRQAWRSAESGRLERFGVSPSAAQAAKTNEVDHAGGKENQATIWGIHD